MARRLLAPAAAEQEGHDHDGDRHRGDGDGGVVACFVLDLLDIALDLAELGLDVVAGDGPGAVLIRPFLGRCDGSVDGHRCCPCSILRDRQGDHADEAGRSR